jgi:bla regulator protein blaR1
MLPALIHASTSFLIAMADAAARSLMLACFAAAALGAFRVKNVRTRLLLWEAVLLAALAMPLLTSLTPAIQIAVPLSNLQERSASVEIPATQPAPAHTSISESSARTRTRSVERVKAGSAVISTEAGQAAVAASASSAARRGIPWPILAVSAYLAIGLVFLARVFIGARFGKHLVRAATPIEDADASRMLSAASRAAELRVPPRLAESEMISVPMVLGVRAPAILFPPDWRKWDEGELAAVLAHEVSHVERHDALAQRLALIHRAIFWFSPLAWWLERHLAELSEQASDDAALGSGADRTRYAETLLGFFAELEAGPERVWWQGVSIAKAGQAEKRVDRILAWRGAMSNRLKKSLVVALVAIAAPVVALTAAMRPAAYDVQAPAAPPAPPAPKADADPTPNPPQPSATAAKPARAPEPQSDETLSEVVVPPIHVILPPMPAIRMPRIPPVAFAMLSDLNSLRGFHGGYFVGRFDDWGPRFVIVTKDSDAITMSGDREDAEHAKSLRSKIPGEFIWFENDDKSYVIRDQATVDRAKTLWEPQEKLSKEQEELGKQQEALGEQQEEAARKMEELKLKIPDLSAEMQKLQSEMKQLSANGGTMEDIGNLQGELSELQSRIGEVESTAGREQGSFGRQQGVLGQKQGELGRRQGELARQQATMAHEASRQMQQLLDDAIAHGLAKPE